MTLSATLSARPTDTALCTDRIYLYGTDTVAAPRDAIIPRALVRLGVGSALTRTLQQSDRAEFSLDTTRIQRIRYLTVHPSIYIWRFERAMLVMVVRPTGAYHVEAFEGADGDAAARDYAFEQSDELGYGVSLRAPRLFGSMMVV